MKILLWALAAVAATATAGEVRVLTFNIRYDNPDDQLDGWANRREAVAALIEEQADVAGLQEVKPGQRAWLAEHLPNFQLVGLGREPKDQDEAVPVLFRKDRYEMQASGTFWLSATPEVPGSKSFGNKLPRICTWVRLHDRKADTVLWFYNVHLDHQSDAAREQGLALVLDRMAAREGDAPALLTGDFNSTTDEAPYQMLSKREKPALVSTYAALGMKEEGTFHAFTGKPKFPAIDFIFSEKGRWATKSCTVLKTTYHGVDGKERFVSDHFPVQAVLERK